MSVQEIIGRCENLYNDIDFTYVKDWKEQHQAKAMGYMPVYVPRELIHAAGMEAGAWTVNDEARIRWLLEMGIDRIYTDFPKRMLRLKPARSELHDGEDGG